MALYKSDIKATEEEIHDTTPDPTGFKMLVALPEIGEQTEGGVFTTKQNQDQEKTASIVGFILKQGDLCYKDDVRFPTGKWCNQGDWVIFRAYSGTRFIYKGQEFRLINDDSVEAVVSDPREIRRVGAY